MPDSNVNSVQPQSHAAALSKTTLLTQALQMLDDRGAQESTALNATIAQARLAVLRDSATGAPRHVTIRETQSQAELDQIHRLIHDAYVERGYVEPQPDNRLALYPTLDNIPQTRILIAEEKGQLVGTNSLTLDGPHGLPSDVDFQKECTAIRNEGRRLAGSWRLCTRTGYRDERHIVLDLMASTVRLTRELGVQTCVFTVLPRHIRVYQKLLNMKLVSKKEVAVKGLANVPAVLMRCDYETLPPWTLA